MDGPDRNIRDTLILGAIRIGHGVNLLIAPDTLLLVQQSRRALIKLNLISSSARAFPSALTPATGAGGPNRTNEYYTAVTTFKPSWLEVVQLGRASLKHAFAQPEVETKLLDADVARVAAFEAAYDSDSPRPLWPRSPPSSP